MMKQRVGGACGVLSALLYLVVLWMPAPGGDYDATAIADFIEPDARPMSIVALFLTALWMGLFLRFAASLRERVATVDVRWDWLANVLFGSAIAHVVLTAVGIDLVRTVPVALEVGGAKAPAPEVTYILAQAGWGLVLVLGAWAAISMVLPTMLLARRGVFPGWMLWLGVLTVLGLLVGVIFLPMVVWVVWVLAVSLWLLRPLAARAT